MSDILNEAKVNVEKLSEENRKLLIHGFSFPESITMGDMKYIKELLPSKYYKIITLENGKQIIIPSMLLEDSLEDLSYNE